MNAPSTRQSDVIAIKRLDTRALHLLRAAAVSTSPPSSRPAPPAPLGIAPPAHSGRRSALAIFALGLLLGVFSSRLGDSGSMDVSTRAAVGSEQALPPAPTAAPVAASAASDETNDARPTTTPLPERNPVTEHPVTATPAHHHHHTSGSTAQITVEESPKVAASSTTGGHR